MMPSLAGSRVASLSAHQLGVAALVATGLTNQEAATRLYRVAPHHDFHLRQIFNKLGINSRVELARIVAEQQRDRHDAIRTARRRPEVGHAAQT